MSEDELIPVYYGNVIKPHEARTQPEVKFDSRINLVGEVVNKEMALIRNELFNNPNIYAGR